MQNQMAAQMAAMNANGNGGPIVDGTPIMGNLQHPKQQLPNPSEHLNTYIYDYFLRNHHFQAARAMLDDSNLKININEQQKFSPKHRPNGVNAMDADDWPSPMLPQNQIADNSFLHDWWVQFWDIFSAARTRGAGPSKGARYIDHTRVSRSHARTRRGTDVDV
jgi:hypothetical protein